MMGKLKELNKCGYPDCNNRSLDSSIYCEFHEDIITWF